MKKVLTVLSLFVLSMSLLTGCSVEESGDGNSDLNTNSRISSSVIESQPSQDQLNAETKKNAVKADFVKINSGEWEAGKSVYVEGEVSALSLSDPTIQFTVSQKEGDGYGMYIISSFTTLDESFKEIKNGDTVKAYGIIDEKDSTGMPRILATIIEK